MPFSSRRPWWTPRNDAKEVSVDQGAYSRRWVSLGLAIAAATSCQPPRAGDATPVETAAGLSTATNPAVLGFEDPAAWSVIEGEIPPPTASANSTPRYPPSFLC